MITDVNSKEERNSEHVVELVDEKEGVKIKSIKKNDRIHFEWSFLL